MTQNKRARAMWKKLMPTEIKVEGFSHPEIPEDEFNQKMAEMEKRAPGNDS